MSVSIRNISVKGSKICADVIVNQDMNQVWYEFPWNMEEIAVRPANAFLVAFLPIAMRTGGDIEIEGVVSRNLVKTLGVYQDIMAKWYPELYRVKILAEKTCEDLKLTHNRKIISCFTGGVDAFYTLIKHQEEIDDLLYVWGFDLPLTEKNFYCKVKKHLSIVAQKFNKNIVFVKTNLGFEVTNKYASWGDYCYGPAIASVILLMSSTYKLCLMPSCNDYSVLVPRGSHALLNHLWGCDSVEFVYDGAEASRIEKVAYIADNEAVQEHLRVCYSSNDEYNCCECEKCIRTMVSLEAIDKLDQVKTFYKPLVIEKVSRIELSNSSEEKMAEASLMVAEKNGKEALAVQLRRQISNYKSKYLLQSLNENLGTLMENPDFFNISQKIFDWHIEHNTKNDAKKLLKTTLRKLKGKVLD